MVRLSWENLFVKGSLSWFRQEEKFCAKWTV